VTDLNARGPLVAGGPNIYYDVKNFTTGFNVSHDGIRTIGVSISQTYVWFSDDVVVFPSMQF
jgi:hypothetical protein